MPVNRIVVCSDPLMNSRSEQSLHLRWFPRLIELPIDWVCDAQFVPLAASNSSDSGRFDRDMFFSLSGIRPKEEQGLFSFSPEEISDTSIDYLCSIVDESDLLVGYELSSQTRAVLARADRTYLDIWLHPVRFYDDVLFAASSNDPAVQAAIACHSMDERLLLSKAREIELAYQRGYLRRDARLPDGAGLFVGQTASDKALMSGNKMLGLADFKDEYHGLGRTHRHILYSRHPMVHSGDGAEMRIIKSSGFSSVTSLPTYQLLASPQIEGVYSISSSVVQEARYFGKTAKFFFGAPVSIASSFQSGEYVTLFDMVDGPEFWSSVLPARFGPKLVDRFERPFDRTDCGTRSVCNMAINTWIRLRTLDCGFGG